MMPGYVLIVESNPDLHRRIGDALKEARYELASEAEGGWAQRSIAVRTPDAIVVNTLLADGCGFRLAEQLRRDPDTRATPLFFIASGYRGASHRAEARRRFAPAEYLTTPLDVNTLLALMLQTVPPAGTVKTRTVPPEPTTKDPIQQRERRDVERSAKTLGEHAELRGTLKRIPFARLLQRFFGQRSTGSLLLLRDTTKKIVQFIDGYPVSARSNVLGECLGQILVGQKLISSEALTLSVTRMQKERRHQGEILVEMGALSPHNLQRALIEQVEAKLFEVFSWRDGNFMFKEGLPASHDAPPLRLDRPPAALILEGIRRHYDAGRQQAVLDAFAGRHVSLSGDPMLRLQEMTSDPTELAFIRTIDGTSKLETVLANAAIAPEKARLLLVALSEAGMIEPTDAPARRKGSSSGVIAVEVPRPAPPPSATGSGGISSPVPFAGAQLATVATTLRTQSYFWALGVEPTASVAEIDVAYDTLARSFHGDRYRNSPDDDRHLAQEIFDRLGEAHRVLRDPARRRAYLAKLEREGERGENARRRIPEAAMVSPGTAPADAGPAATARVLYETGHEHLRARRHHEAVEAFRQAARLVPGEADFRAALGWSLFREAPADARAGRAALAELRRAVQIDAENQRALHYLAQFYAQTGQPELAIRELERILEIDPTAADAADELRRLRDNS
jgi:curved DNA-binding protein CbpA/CheY-like chemotaxis protein